MRLLFVKPTLAWPRSSGHDIYTYYTMQSCIRLGHEVSLATVESPSPEALGDLSFANRVTLEGRDSETIDLPASWLQERYRSYWGISKGVLSSLNREVSRIKPDAVVIVGLQALPLFLATQSTKSIWFPADELFRHYSSLVRVSDRRSWANLKTALILGVYERAYRKLIDRVWVVSGEEVKAMKLFAGISTADVVPLGVDSDYFSPSSSEIDRHSAVFWGRLDFGPNIQSLAWFCDSVWPSLKKEFSDARFTIIGFKPGPDVMRLANLPGVTVMPDVPDFRDVARSHAVTVLPFVSGGGAKNKLLEAAALGVPIVCTPLATQGLNGLSQAPLSVAPDAASFGDAVSALWRDDSRRMTVAKETRRWIVENHDWMTTARIAMSTLAKAT